MTRTIRLQKQLLQVSLQYSISMLCGAKHNGLSHHLTEAPERLVLITPWYVQGLNTGAIRNTFLDFKSWPFCQFSHHLSKKSSLKTCPSYFLIGVKKPLKGLPQESDHESNNDWIIHLACL
jgi:hypothetical protein